jgi:hypothetical protein
VSADLGCAREFPGARGWAATPASDRKQEARWGLTDGALGWGAAAVEEEIGSGWGFDRGRRWE